MSDVVLSGAMRSSLLSMQGASKLLDQTQNRVATGLKVNSAVDNPQSFFTAQGLNNRASDLSTLLDNMGLAVQTLKAASQGIDAIQKLVQQAKATANQALQMPIEPTTLTTAVSAKNYSGSGNSETLTIAFGDVSTSITLNQNITSAGVLQAAISAAGIDGLTVTNSGGNLSFSIASGAPLTLSGSATGTGEALAGDLTSSNGTNRQKAINDYNALLDQIDQLAGDASFNGVNLLQSGTVMVVNFNEQQTSKLSIGGIRMDASGLGLSRLTSDAFNTADGIKTVQDGTDASMQTLRVESTSFASSLSIVQARENFTKNLINTLQAGASGLTLADTNEEAANLLALQTRQQLGVQALSIASQSEQSILRLF